MLLPWDLCIPLLGERGCPDEREMNSHGGEDMLERKNSTHRLERESASSRERTCDGEREDASGFLKSLEREWAAPRKRKEREALVS